MLLPLLVRDAIDDGVANPRGQSLAVMSIVFACLSVTFLSARLFTRYFIHKSFGPDDYLIIAATVGKWCLDVVNLLRSDSVLPLPWRSLTTRKLQMDSVYTNQYLNPPLCSSEA